jgi:F-type H+-transporting ATPase subunit gamma
MKMVSAAKLRRAQEAVLQARPYANKEKEVMSRLFSSQGNEDLHPLFAKRGEDRILVVVFSSDKGLCGAFNSNLFKAIMKFIGENEGKDIHVSSVGKKGRDFFRRRKVTMETCWLDFARSVNYQFSSSVAKDIVEIYKSGKVDMVYIVYNKFRTVMAQDVVFEALLPLGAVAKDSSADKGAAKDNLYEPSAKEVFDAIVEKHIEFQVYQALLESWASFNGSQMVAMDSATRNAGDMIAKLTLQYNRARQGAITKELIEIVSGADALKG